MRNIRVYMPKAKLSNLFEKIRCSFAFLIICGLVNKICGVFCHNRENLSAV